MMSAPPPFLDEKPRTECGILALIAQDPSIQIAPTIFQGLMALQHRGQEAAGISVVDNSKRLHTYKNRGLVYEALSIPNLVNLWGSVGIGHVRYGTAGSGEIINAQPFHYETTQSPPFAIVFNGNITNYPLLKDQLLQKGRIFLTNGDTEVIANLIASNCLVTQNWVENLEFTAKLLDGSFSLILLTNEGDIFAYRSGNKPLCLGVTQLFNTEIYIIASESCAIHSLGGTLLRDVDPGEIVHVHQDQTFHTESRILGEKHHCVFEYIYFARGDSIIDGRSVHFTREQLGKILAKQETERFDNPIVVPVPDSGRSAALGYAAQLQIPYDEGLMKNRYVFRSFITPSQAERMNLVRMKLSTVDILIRDRDVILIDDSIVRGTTMNRIVNLIRNAGAQSVHVRSSSPPIAFPCYYGVDFPNQDELIYGQKLQTSQSHTETLERIRREIGADSVNYLTIEGLVAAIDLPREDLCLACLNGSYWYSHDSTRRFFQKGRI